MISRIRRFSWRCHIGPHLADTTSVHIWPMPHRSTSSQDRCNIGPGLANNMSTSPPCQDRLTSGRQRCALRGGQLTSSGAVVQLMAQPLAKSISSIMNISDDESWMISPAANSSARVLPIK